MKACAWTCMLGGSLGLVFFGCSATSGGSGVDASGNRSSTGASSSGGSGPSSLGGLGTGASLSSGGDTANGGAVMGCNDLTVETQPVTPTVLLLVDNSSSMFEPRAQVWDPLYDALMTPNSGVVHSLQSKVRFGFTSYRGSSIANDPACPTLFPVDYALDNYDAIKFQYDKQGAEWKQGDKWETPTGAAIKKAAEALAAYTPDPPGPKYIVVVTDGNPNTCGALDPQCGSDESILAVQAAHALGIGTFAVGIGAILTGNNGCEPAWGRCGVLHLQDLANAGQGLLVQAPPDQLRYQACTPTQALAAKYAGPAETAGAAPYFTAANAAELQAALSGLLNSVVSCTYDMNAEVIGDAALGTVTLNDEPVTFNDPDGWKLEATKYQITLTGEACESFKSTPGSKLNVSFPCKVAKPR